MFLHVSVILFRGGQGWYPSMPCSRGVCYPSMPCSRRVPALGGVPAPGGACSQGGVCSQGIGDPPKADDYCCGRYTSYCKSLHSRKSFILGELSFARMPSRQYCLKVNKVHCWNCRPELVNCGQ